MPGSFLHSQEVFPFPTCMQTCPAAGTLLDSLPYGVGAGHSKDTGACPQPGALLGFLSLGSLVCIPPLSVGSLRGTFQLKLNHIPPSLPGKDSNADSSCDTTGSSGSSWLPKEGLRRGSRRELKGPGPLEAINK